MSLGFQGSKFFTVCWWLGKGTAGVIALALLKPLLQKCLKSIVSQLSGHMQKIWANLVGSSGAEIEAGIEESSAEADAAIAEEAGIEIAEIGAAEIAIGVLSFIAIGLIVAVLGIVFIFVLHESSQRVRIWNVTSYKARWMIYFDEGQMVSGPVKFNSDGSINTFVPFMPVERKVTPEAHYGDLIIDSASGIHGIGYVIQIQLVDPNHEDDVKYACTLMYDIPFAGDNSTAVTFDHITDVGKFYSDNMGVHRCTQQTAQSSDGRIRATTTYDYLRGEHVKPQQVDSSGGNVAYYYQSVILLEEKDLSV
ncbi:hypothetical protein Mapa_009035 [Marchantia paleacea]|nr:hypothetical protein Mapa_009035 [Marchantia paleacea]